MKPETHYARSGEVNIAYQVVGEGPRDLVLVPGWVSNIEVFWEEPSMARFLQRLASFSRLILFDKRGTGLSDRVSDMPNLETRMDDVRAVMDAVRSTRAALLGYSEGGPLCMVFGATYPERYDLLFRGGLRIHTTVDLKLQAEAEAAVRGVLLSKRDPYAAMTVLDPRDGAIRAMVGGRGYFSKDRFAKVNLATGGITGRQAGSAFKPFTLVTALDRGISPLQVYPAPPSIRIPLGQGRSWDVSNFEQSNLVIGPIPDFPASSASQVERTSFPSGVTHPSPVITTRRMKPSCYCRSWM